MKKKILCIVGKSGVGKTTSAEYIEDTYKIKTLESLTERKPRYDGEQGHTFVSKDEFDKIKPQEMIAYTLFGGNRYCCLHKDLKDKNIYVIDPTGLKWLKEHFTDLYDIKSVYIKRNTIGISKERLNRDKGMYFLSQDYYDFVIDNNHSFDFLYSKLDNIVNKFF